MGCLVGLGSQWTFRDHPRPEELVLRLSSIGAKASRKDGQLILPPPFSWLLHVQEQVCGLSGRTSVDD